MAPRKENLQEKLAWIHRDATTLGTDDLVELKYSLERLIARSTEALGITDAQLRCGFKKAEY